MKAKSIALFVAVAAVPFASAQSLTTLYAQNNSGSVGGAVYFDAVVGANALTVTSFDTNTSSIAAFTMDIYTRAGTYVGAETSTAGWTLMATGSGTGAGLDLPSSMTLNNTFNLAANATTGFALVMDAATQHNYTNGNGPNQTYSNSDLTLNLGSATNLPFSGAAGGPFSPRVWNGTIYYRAVPEPATMAVLGLGALGLLRRRRK